MPSKVSALGSLALLVVGILHSVHTVLLGSDFGSEEQLLCININNTSHT